MKLKEGDIIRAIFSENEYLITNIGKYAGLIKITQWKIINPSYALENGFCVKKENLQFFKLVKEKLTNNHPQTTLFK